VLGLWGIGGGEREKMPGKKVLIEFFRISCIFLSSQGSGLINVRVLITFY
jgi:hypothetical protein